jgi:hypothetical protein
VSRPLKLGETLEHEGVKYVLVRLTPKGAATAESDAIWQRINSLIGRPGAVTAGGCTTCVVRAERPAFHCSDLCAIATDAFVVRENAIPYLALEGVLI